MHDDDYNTVESLVLPGYPVAEAPAPGTLFTVVENDPAKQAAVDRSIAVD